MHLTDTIAAVSTPRGKGGIAVIRVSGADTATILKKVFFPKGKDPVGAPRRVCFGSIRDRAGEVLDEGLCVFFAAPASFTGEDVAEISCHGGMLVTETVLAALLAAGARMAEPGEFTRCALMNGKMRLSEAEALGALLDAGTAGQLALARGGMEGRLADAVRDAYARLSLILSDVYAKIDFPDEDLNSMNAAELRAAWVDLADTLTRLSATWQTGRAVAEGIETVICGPVNAGKSTLYNALVGREAAIVTEVAGTTRDILSETVSLGRVTLRLSDTAGLRETTDRVEKIGVDRALAAAGKAELVIAVFDGEKEPDEADAALAERLTKLPGTVIAVVNKSDKPCRIPSAFLRNFDTVVRLAAKNNEIEPLVRAVEQRYMTDGIDLRHDAVVANARQYAALTRAGEALGRAIAVLDAGLPLDAACVEAEAAMQALGEVDGRTVDEDIVADIFSHFCVGK